MNMRIKELRQVLHLDQQNFGKSIGLAPTTISAIETGYRQLSDRNISIICDAFNVNEHWLRTGEGDIFLPTNTSSIDSLKKEYNLSDIECKLVELYINLSPAKRNEFTNILFNMFSHSD